MSRIILQNLDKYTQLLELDTLTGEKIPFDRDPDSHPRIGGHFAQIEGYLVLFYRDDDILHFEANGINVALDGHIQAILEASKAQNQLILSHDAVELIRVQYDPRKLEQPIKGDPTGFIEPEQFDICLFVNNVLNDEDRKAGIYRDLED